MFYETKVLRKCTCRQRRNESERLIDHLYKVVVLGLELIPVDLFCCSMIDYDTIDVQVLTWGWVEVVYIYLV